MSPSPVPALSDPLLGLAVASFSLPKDWDLSYDVDLCDTEVLPGREKYFEFLPGI